MPPTTPRAKEHQERWREIVDNLLLSQLPYNVETNDRGQVVLSPHPNRHTFQQKAVQKKLGALLSGGEAFQGLAIATSGGTKQADVLWVSDDRRAEMKETGDSTTLAPEICIEVLSASNTADEIRETLELYVESGAEEVWVVDEDDPVRFFGQEQMEESALVPNVPAEL
jgi:Uma2 family endonuclease